MSKNERKTAHERAREVIDEAAKNGEIPPPPAKFKAPKCPICQRDNVKVMSKRYMVRYLKCTDCEWTFKMTGPEPTLLDLDQLPKLE